MLRASSLAFDYPLDIRGFVDPSVDLGIPGADVLLRLVDSVLAETEPLTGVHTDIIDRLGPESLLDAAAVFGNFEMMNRVAEGTGIPIAKQRIDRNADVIETLGISTWH